MLHDSERDLADVLDRCRARIEGLGARLVAVGMLPTLSAEQLTVERISHNPRYELLSSRMRAARHRPFQVRIIDGCEPVEFSTDSVAPNAATTSLQLHLRVPPDRFAAYYNAAQMIAGAQVAVAANSPYLLARQVWQETRIALLEQLLDTRRRSEVRAGAPARVRLGDRWVNGPMELFDDLVRLFPPLFPMLEAEDPDAASGPGALRPCVSSGYTTERCGAGIVRSMTSRRGARSCASKTGYCPADRLPSTWSPTPRSTTAWSARSSTATQPLGSRCPSRRPSRTCTARHETGWQHGCAGRASTAPSTSSPVRSCCRPRRPGSTLGAWMRTTVTATSVSSKRGFDAAVLGAAGQTEAVRYLEEHGMERITARREMTRRYASTRTPAPQCTNGPCHDRLHQPERQGLRVVALPWLSPVGQRHRDSATPRPERPYMGMDVETIGTRHGGASLPGLLPR